MNVFELMEYMTRRAACKRKPMSNRRFLKLLKKAQRKAR